MITSLQLPTEGLDKYKSNSQKIRVATEKWFHTQMYCPSCPADTLGKFSEGRPVADFYCDQCKLEYELKSKGGKSFPGVIRDGAYNTMIERITSNTNPHFWFLLYDKNSFSVINLILIPNYFFTPEVIIKQPPLSPTAKRAGWVGCNISIKNVPITGRLHIIKDSQIVSSEVIRNRWQEMTVFREDKISGRRWLMKVLRCVETIPTTEFSLSDIYHFEKQMKSIFPDNNNVQAKIRQQLQILRDKKIISFEKRGRYKKLL